jgi:hypothetical protein
MSEYQTLLETFSLDANRVRHTSSRVDDEIASFFSPQGHTTHHLDNKQVLDFEGVKGRLLSSSYSPLPGHPNHDPMVARLNEIFKTYQQDGVVNFLYKTHVYYGRLAS